MKKLIFALLIGLLLLFTLCACNQSDDNESTTPENTTESVSPDATTPEGTTSASTPDESTDPDNNQNDTSTDAPIYERSPELDEIFKLLEGDASIIGKIQFHHSEESEKLHYELKNSGLYDTDKWSESAFQIVIRCNYKAATNEVWYKQTVHSQIDTKALNEAFYNYCKSDFSGGEFSNIVFLDGLFFLYTSPDEFLADYTAMKALLALEYVSSIEICYIYGLPSGYVME